MLPKINRLKKKRDFEIVFEKGKSSRDNFLALRAAPNNSEISRFGFIVSKKISKKAVVRNKIRRRLSFAIEQEIKNIKKGVDVILVALPGIEKKEFSEIQEAVKGALNRVKLTSTP